jgi:hypothetical protein
VSQYQYGQVHAAYAHGVWVAGMTASRHAQIRAMAHLMAIPGMNPGTCSRLASGAAARLRSGADRWLVGCGLPLSVARATVRILRGEPEDGDLPGARNDTGQVPQ